MKKIDWSDFEHTCKNTTKDFEDLCRIFFRIRYLKDKVANLPQRANNPGIETLPINVNGSRLGFQAKYFPGKISYTDILDSAKKVLKYYSGEIDKVIIFCNKNIDNTTTNYKKAKGLLASANIEIELCCNNNILDPINTVEEYSSIKALYFNGISFSNDWFARQLQKSLDGLKPRYSSGFHVDTEEWHTYFEVLYRTDYIEKTLQEKIDAARKELRNLYGVDDLKKDILEIINGLVIPNRNNYEYCLQWYSLFLPVKQKLDEVSAPTYAEQRKIIYGERKYTNEESEKIQRKYDKFETLKKVIKSFDLSKDKYLKHLNNNVLLIEGRAGIGKSHLLGYEAEWHGNSGNCRSVLLLGHKFVLNLQPQSQIMIELELASISFHEFLEACEAKGEVDGGITVIMIDALNECAEHKAWRAYFNDIINEVRKYKYVRFVCSIRSTYKEIFLMKAY